MNNPTYFDTIIIGGGLAGLSLSIQLAKAGFSVALFEKEQYPFHKVCGEYISMESWNFIESLGLSLNQMQLPVIKNLLVTAPGGNSLHQSLSLGGFGVSRYTLDHQLKNIAQKTKKMDTSQLKCSGMFWKNSTRCQIFIKTIKIQH